MKSSLLAQLAIALAVTAVAPAFADLALAKDKQCLNCHSVEKKVLGPAFKDVAAKYAGDKSAVDKLANRILKGAPAGTTVWGISPMPANLQVNEAEAKKLAAWVMTLK